MGGRFLLLGRLLAATLGACHEGEWGFPELALAIASRSASALEGQPWSVDRSRKLLVGSCAAVDWRRILHAFVHVFNVLNVGIHLRNCIQEQEKKSLLRFG